MDMRKTQLIEPEQIRSFLEHHTRIVAERLVLFVSVGIALIVSAETAILWRLESFRFVAYTYVGVAVYFMLTLGVILYCRSRGFWRQLRWYLVVFSFVFVYSQTLVTIFDQRIHGSIAAYLLSLFIVSAFFYTGVAHACALFVSSSAFFLVGVWLYQPDPSVRMANLVNGSVLSAIAFIGSILNYRLFRSNFVSKMQVEQVNATLENRVSEQVAVILRSEKLKTYLPSQLVESLLAGHSHAEMPTERRKITVFFSDIRDFTPKTESLEPEDLTGLLNDYLTEMTRIAVRYGGTIDKIIGDAIMILFGAPQSMGDRENALQAVRMAVEMQQRLRQLREKWFNEGIEEPFEVRIGISTGMALVGNFGAKERLSYTAVGQCVNIAARLQQVCVPGSVLISHPTWVLVKDDIPSSEGRKVPLKGYDKDFLVYDVAVE